jgi:hypothetical protein
MATNTEIQEYMDKRCPDKDITKLCQRFLIGEILELQAEIGNLREDLGVVATEYEWCVCGASCYAKVALKGSEE